MSFRVFVPARAQTRQYIRKNLDIAVRVNALLKKGMQQDLAKTLGKTESEVSRMLSGLHVT